MIKFKSSWVVVAFLVLCGNGYADPNHTELFMTLKLQNNASLAFKPANGFNATLNPGGSVNYTFSPHQIIIPNGAATVEADAKMYDNGLPASFILQTIYQNVGDPTDYCLFTIENSLTDKNVHACAQVKTEGNCTITVNPTNAWSCEYGITLN